MSMTNLLKMHLQRFNGTGSQSIFELVTAPEIAAYWTTKTQEQPPYLGEELFPNDKQLGTDLKWFVGQSGAPKALQPSAFGAKAIPRDRKEFDKVVTALAFFKESKYIDEEIRQDLLKVMQTGNQVYIDAVLNNIFADNIELIDGASVRREITRMELLTTGKVEIEGNGQSYSLDYGFDDTHVGYAPVSWSDYENADPFKDIQTGIERIQLDTGVAPTRAVTNLTTFNKIVANMKLNKTIAVFGGGEVIIGKRQVMNYFLQELNLEIVLYDKVYDAGNGEMKKFTPDEKFILLPPTTLGTTWFGTTPEEADLMASNVANVSVVDTGVAVTTSKQTDPVTVETKVSMLSLPSFENIKQVYILNTVPKV